MSARLKTRFIPVWKEAPCLRMLIPLMAGIICQWYLVLSLTALVITSVLLLFVAILIYQTTYKTTFRLGVVVFLGFITMGCWLVVLKDSRNWKQHIAKHYYTSETVIATIQEPLAARTNNYKTTASVALVDSNGNRVEVAGNIILYVAADSISEKLQYGNTIVFKKALMPITSAGNPGGFDYKRYAAFNNMYYQAFLKSDDYVIAPYKTYNRFRQLLFTTRSFVLGRFKKFIPGKVEAGMAEALLVGYKDDLDKGLVESYANTGVVHIIAISGMHLGLIYVLLFFVFKPLKNKKYGVVLNGFLIIAALWFFSLLTGAAPSITRSAIMFTVIVFGNSFGKTTTIYNSLSISALLLLLYNPFNLWDVGFQLSYAALLSIALLGTPIRRWVHIPNKWLDNIWQLIAVTLAAQVFTLPLVLYHFHQFPTLFLLANMVAVPLSSLILYTLIFLLPLSFVPYVSVALGWCCFYLIKSMNVFIAFIDKLPFSRFDSIYVSFPQALVLIIAIAGFCWWLLRRTNTALITGLSALVIFIGLWQLQFYKSTVQQKLIIYNVPKKTAIDIINGRHFSFIGDTSLQQKGFLQNFHLLPSRIQSQVSFDKNIDIDTTAFTKVKFGEYSLLLLDKSPDVKHHEDIIADYLVIGKKCHTKPYMLLASLHCKTIILDGSFEPRYFRQWKNAADSLHLRLHSVQQQGAFIIDF